MKKMIKSKLNVLRNTKERLSVRECAICNREFKVRSPFCRFCADCKRENELYQVAEWLPDFALAV